VGGTAVAGAAGTDVAGAGVVVAAGAHELSSNTAMMASEEITVQVFRISFSPRVLKKYCREHANDGLDDYFC
jgi:hypothetical protein